ncbi:MAG: shikimate kinase [Lepagella sp.]
MRPVFIIGYMASGKTTFGRALARVLNREFIDLDFYIEQRYHSTIAEIFRREGEEGFRRKESAMLREVADFEGIIVACGGGTPCFNDNMDLMLDRGLTVWLTATEECIVRRLMINNSRRPLMAGKSEEEIRQEVARGLETRLPYYSRAQIEHSGEHLESVKEIDSNIETFLRSANILI